MNDNLTEKLPHNDPMKQMASTLQIVASQVGALQGRFDQLEQKFDERLHDTRPMWEQVQQELLAMKENQDVDHEQLLAIKQQQDVDHEQLLAIKQQQVEDHASLHRLEHATQEIRT